MESLLKAVVLAVSVAGLVSAHPSTHIRHAVGRRAVSIEAFNPPTTYETFGAGIDHAFSKRQEGSLKDSTLAVVEDKTGYNSSEIAFKSGYSSSSGKYGYVRQKHAGIEFANSAANVAFKDDKLVAFGSSFVRPKKIASNTPTITVSAAVSKAEAVLNGKLDSNVEPKLEYLVKSDGSAVLTHVLRISNDADFKFYEAFVNAHSGEVESVVDFVNEVTYRVVPITKQSIAEGDEILVNPEDTFSSPNGWTIPRTGGTLETAGNNVISTKGTTTTVQSGPNEFLYAYDVTQEPTVAVNVNAATVNTFYVVNKLHDIWYRYGFTESAYNFQTDNLGKGGAGNDRVLVSVQDGGGTNNANFATPPDGSSGQMRMYIFTQTTPRRDGDMNNDIVTHEYTHGLTNRMIGGGTARCLQTTEARGMGEGWSDAMAEWTEQKSANVTDFTTGQWVLNRASGVRRYPYSISSTTNPLKYSNVPGSTTVHQIGEIWANMLHNVYYQLVQKYGFANDAFTNTSGTQGNTVYAHLFLDSLSLMPCNPTFITARNAIIQADANRYGGANKCLLWSVFASKGLGVNAVAYTNDATVPAGC